MEEAIGDEGVDTTQCMNRSAKMAAMRNKRIRVTSIKRKLCVQQVQREKECILDVRFLSRTQMKSILSLATASS
jgi:hypothetical protein